MFTVTQVVGQSANPRCMPVRPLSSQPPRSRRALCLRNIVYSRRQQEDVSGSWPSSTAGAAHLARLAVSERRHSCHSWRTSDGSELLLLLLQYTKYRLWGGEREWIECTFKTELLSFWAKVVNVDDLVSCNRQKILLDNDVCLHLHVTPLTQISEFVSGCFCRQ